MHKASTILAIAGAISGSPVPLVGGWSPPRRPRDPVVAQWLQLRAAEKRARRAAMALGNATGVDFDHVFGAWREARDVLAAHESAQGWAPSHPFQPRGSRRRRRRWRRARGLL